MKIALPTRNRLIDGHFGHCETFTVFTVNPSNQVDHEETVPSPQGCGCKSDIAGILSRMGVSVMLAGNMGQGAVQVLQRHGITVYRGCEGDVRKVTEAFLTGNIQDSGESCATHGHHHGADHAHHHGDHTCSHH